MTMDLNWNPLFQAQSKLQTEMFAKHPKQEGEDVFIKMVNAFIREVAELMEDTKCFKRWSVKPPKPKEVQLEEYVDGLHFLLIIGLELDVKEFTIGRVEEIAEKDVNYLFHDTYSMACTIGYNDRQPFPRGERVFEYLVTNYLALGHKLGFTSDEIEKAYFSKHEENYKRQESGTY